MVSAFGIRKHVLVAISVYLYFTALVFGNVNNRSDTFRNGGNKSSKVKTNVNVRSTSQRSYVEREQDSSKTTGSVEDSSEEQFEHDVDTSKEQVAESIIFDSDNTCSRSCLEKEERKKVTVEAIKKNILTKLGLERPPEISTKHRHNGRVVRQMLRNGLMKPILMKEAEMQGDEPFYEPEEEDLQWKGFDTEGDDFHVFPKTVFALAHTAPECRGWDTIYDFTFSKETMRAKVSKAQIWIYLRGAKYYNLTEVMYWNATTSLWGQDYYHYNTSSEGQEYFNTTTTRGGPHHVSHHLLPHDRRQGGNVTRTDPVVDVAVRVKWLYRLPDGSHKTVSVSSSKQQLPQGEGGWIQINVSEFVSYWFSSFTSSLMSVVEVLDSLDDKMTLTEEAEQLTEVPPILEVSAVKKRHRRRSRRSLGMDCDGTKDEKRCCRYPLTVDFEKFGWDWIIAPKKYEANDCSGECPYVFLQKYPYTHIASMENKTICCAPRKMSSISMLYFDKDSNILLSTLPGMVVETCGCF